MISIPNIDLLSVGITVTASLILGVIIFINNRRSVTNLFFLLFIVVNIGWSIFNYLNYQTTDPLLVLWAIRLVLFFATLQAFSFFMLMYVFPGERLEMSSRWKWILSMSAIIVAIFTLTPFVFSRVVITPGQVAQPIPAFGIGIFGIFGVLFVVSGIVLLIKKIRKAPTRIEKLPFEYLLGGLVVMFILIIIFNFLYPAFFNDTRFIPLAAVFTLPFIIATTYAIFRHHLLHVKTIAAEIFAALLSLATIFELLYSTTLVEIILRSLICVLVLIFSIFLITSVWKEEEQREELQRLDKELQDKNLKLDELSHFKSELLSLASHQIRSPLAAIKGFATLIVGGSYGDTSDKVKETVGKMGKSADELIALINTLLDVRKVEEGKMEYQFEKTDLTKMVGDVVDSLKSIAENKKLEFNFASPGKELWVNADPQKFKQVIQNLTDNALKYTPSGFVHVELKEDSGFAIVSVADSGLGIPETLVPHLFEEFIRDERVKKQILGTGLGLYIANKIAEAHGGKISAESPGEGKGSTFHVRIPLMK